MDEKDPKNYELAVLLSSEEQVAQIATMLREHEATVTGEPRVRKMALAYPVKKATEAVFASYLFSAVPSKAKQLEQDLSVRQDILRSMIIIAIPPEDTRTTSSEGNSAERRPRAARTSEAVPATASASKTPAPHASNEALEKQLEEILK